MSTQAISNLNEAIKAKTHGDQGPRHAAQNSKHQIAKVTQSLDGIDSGSEQAAALSLVHYAALQPVLDRMDRGSLEFDPTSWSRDQLTDQFKAKQLTELLRTVRDNQSWGLNLKKRQTAHMIRTGFCGSSAESDYDDAEDGVYHSHTESFLRIIQAKDAVECQEDDENYAERDWRSADDADCEADMSDTDATESTGSDTSENSDSDDADSAADATESTGTAEVGAMMQKLIDKRIDERIDNVDDSDCDCDSVTEERIREIVREEVKDLLGDLV
ncbi:hypothetical protein [Salinibacter ruber]|uniref:Uncharacterized protein n=1 Tax=Salinibacter ruber TaxID=146919 RepID=A0A9X2TL73_9BACT|nr:hypothetical protein [Salinibacter ruber]MCS3661786.1 hypothetical protein [Salinibacter ruber]MCS3711553.1 hypothetical protein [Salinibacter ruber]